MKTKDKITLEIEGYYKKGDDFEFLLREYSPQKALEMWGEGLVEMGKNLQRAAELLKNEKLEAGAAPTLHGSAILIRKLQMNFSK